MTPLKTSIALRHRTKFYRIWLYYLMLVVFFGMLGPTLCRAAPKKKVLFVDSYHSEYIWSNDITTGIHSVLDSRQDIELKIFRMDTKRHISEEYKKKVALQARELIESWQPDVLIASDDIASKYLIAPYYLNTTLPVVFCGLNWDGSVYGFPADNVTGMLEVALVEETLGALRTVCQGQTYRLPGF